MRTSLLAVPVVAAVVLSACADAPTVCNAVGHAGLIIEARDAVTHELVPSDLSGVARSGAYVETLVGNGAFLVGLHERPGRYAVSIEAPGYASWDSAGVTVREADQCHVETTALTVLLAPEDPAAAT